MAEIVSMNLVDLWRLVLMVVSIFLACVSLRLAHLCTQTNRLLPREERTYGPMFYVAMAAFLIAVVALRPKHFGEGVNADILVLTPCVTLAAIALMPRIKMSLRPPR